MLQFSGEKMSKSVGNLVTISQFLSQHEADVLRMLVLNSSYRSPLTYNEEVVEQSERALERLRSAIRTPIHGTDHAAPQTAQTLQLQMETTRQGFIEAMDDDFNTAGALGQLFDLVRAVNQARDAGVEASDLKSAQNLLIELTEVLGLRLERTHTPETQVDPFVELLIEVRNELRNQKLWALSDKVRDRLGELSVILEDSKEGTTWRWK
jgi:cysteinyl-tRNA synthetase